MLYDVIIVGAGPAGSTAAKYLSEMNLNVLLIDKAIFPRKKPCGGGIPVQVLDKLPYLKNSDLIQSYSYGGQIYSSSSKFNININKYISIPKPQGS